MGFFKELFNPSKPDRPQPVPVAQQADTSVISSGREQTRGLGSLISNRGGASGLKRKASTAGKRSLIGGA